MNAPRLSALLLLVLVNGGCDKAKPSDAECGEQKLEVGMQAITACAALRDAGIEMEPFEDADPKVDKIFAHLKEAKPACGDLKVSQGCSEAVLEDTYRRVACDAAERALSMLKASSTKGARARVDEIRSVVADGRKKCF